MGYKLTKAAFLCSGSQQLLNTDETQVFGVLVQVILLLRTLLNKVLVNVKLTQHLRLLVLSLIRDYVTDAYG